MPTAERTNQKDGRRTFSCHHMGYNRWNSTFPLICLLSTNYTRLFQRLKVKCHTRWTSKSLGFN